MTIVVLKIIIAFIIILLEALLVRKYTQSEDYRNPQSKPAQIKSSTTHPNQQPGAIFSLPFRATALFDLKGHGKQYLFIGGGYNQLDKLFIYREGNFLEITQKTHFSTFLNDKAYCALAINTTHNGGDNLFVARDSGLYFYENLESRFNIKKLNIPFDDGSIPISIALVNLRKKNAPNFLITTYNYQKAYDGKTLFLINNGDNTFTVITDILNA